MPYMLHKIWKTDISVLTEEQVWDHYEKCLRAHDWTYNFSDDGGVWRAGEEQLEHLSMVRKLCESYDKDRADKLFYKYSYWHKEDGSLLEL